MKKMIIVLAAGIISTAAIAQKADKPVPPPPPAPAEAAALPVPPPPPPPPPPKAPVTKSNKGYIISVVPGKTDDDAVILLKKNGIVQKIRMSVWNAKPEYFENKYGMLPPPPPPPPPPVKEEI